jgi:hypothetical protein
MPISNFFGVGVGLVDKAALDANFAVVSSGTSSVPVNNIVAHAGGGQALATQIVTALVARVSTVATIGDSVALPLAAGQRVILVNAATNSMNVFAFNGSSDTINGTAGSTAYALAGGKTAEFVSAGATFWNVLLSA